METPQSYILLTHEPEEAIARLAKEHRGESLKLFVKEEFLLEDSQEVLAQAHLATSIDMTLLLAAKSYNLYAQNALLKILEEPPKRIAFILLASSKTALLPTIRSRLPILDARVPVALDPFALDLHQLSLQEVYGYLKTLQQTPPSKENLKRMVESLLLSARAAKIPLHDRDLALFSRAIFLAEQFERPQNLFLPLLLMILQRRKDATAKPSPRLT